MMLETSGIKLLMTRRPYIDVSKFLSRKWLEENGGSRRAGENSLRERHIKMYASEDRYNQRTQKKKLCCDRPQKGKKMVIMYMKVLK